MSKLFFKWIVFIVVIVTISVINFFFFSSIKQKEIPLEDIKIKEVSDPRLSVIGKSVQGRNIEAYSFGKGDKLLTFVGGIHGGYEWNSVYLAYTFIDYLIANPDIIPDNITIIIIPSANPDGLFQITGKDGRFILEDIKTDDSGLGRFNANNVDLNRNFDCKWKAEGLWRNKIVSAGKSAFSEPEAIAIRDFMLSKKPNAVVFWHSQASTVYTSECGNGILPETTNIMNKYSLASGYKTATTFSSYEVTGDAGDWLSTIDIPSITVELSTHESIEWQKNLAGINALLNYFKTLD
jgi:predicted deacylase